MAPYNSFNCIFWACNRFEIARFIRIVSSSFHLGLAKFLVIWLIEKVCKGLLVLSYFLNISSLNDFRLYAYHNLAWISLSCFLFCQDIWVIYLSPYHFLDSYVNFIVFLDCLSIVESLIQFLLEQVISYLIILVLINLSALCLILFFLRVLCIELRSISYES